MLNSSLHILALVKTFSSVCMVVWSVPSKRKCRRNWLLSELLTFRMLHCMDRRKKQSFRAAPLLRSRPTVPLTSDLELSLISENSLGCAKDAPIRYKAWFLETVRSGPSARRTIEATCIDSAMPVPSYYPQCRTNPAAFLELVVDFD